jgi:hypothetical protein
MQKLMLKNSKFLINNLIFIILLSSCIPKRNEFTFEKIPKYNTSGEFVCYDSILKSNPYFDKQNKNGNYTLSYISGELKEIAEFRNDTLINENILYDKFGNIISYRFYNPKGKLCYIYEISEFNVLITNWEVDPFMYGVITPNAKLGDTIPIEIYVMKPPGVSHNLFGITEDSIEYNLHYLMPKPFKYCFNYIPKKIGINTLLLRLDYKDSISNYYNKFYYNIDFNISQ